ncbi:uncharacterized protein YidB (DUF937 family) [Bradyrhizobium sp. CIR48]|uniref:YidB family protein n=1 Tax=Bradyrhizobium sp. CIR48 TaxID=2663840 RepID=UPI001606C047|nr:YidB family protein [Bradyrhizobium sp. CIR48]MBB4423955.1 uncharacterized protein YidB (DUF937 family) [Bradyrhizobium sp. CIR48]
MRPFDDFGGTFRDLVSRVDESALPRLIGAALQTSQVGDLQSVVVGLEKKGLAETVSSWAEKAPTPFSAKEVEAALGAANIGRVAMTLGIPAQSAAELLAESLPTAVGVATRSGSVVLQGSVGKKNAP